MTNKLLVILLLLSHSCIVSSLTRSNALTNSVFHYDAGSNHIEFSEDADKASVDTFLNKTFCVNGIMFQMVKVQGGTFAMGKAKLGKNEEPIHKVTLSDYYIGKYEVTQRLWTAIMGSNPSYYEGDERPVECVSWNDCQMFISRLNAITGEQFCLPTEAEWEFAARGGNFSRNYEYSGSDNLNDIAWFSDNSDGKTHDVGNKIPNELGIYDMSGNVWEWCYDWYEEYNSTPQINPKGKANGTAYFRLTRGGSIWEDCWLRNVDRFHRPPHLRNQCFGFRLALHETAHNSINKDNRLSLYKYDNSLHSYYQKSGTFQELISSGKSILEAKEKEYGKKHYEYALSLNNLAKIYSEVGNYSEAIKLSTEALLIISEVFGKEHPYYATILADLANFNSYIGNYSEAICFGSEALNIRERVLGRETSDYATILNNLSSYYAGLNNYVEATRLCFEALQIQEKVYGRMHPNYVACIKNLANYTFALGYSIEALKIGAEVLRLNELLYGKEHPFYMLTLLDVVGYYIGAGHYQEARSLGEYVLHLIKNLHGTMHPEYARCLYLLAYVNSRCFDNDKTYEYLKELLSVEKLLFINYYSTLTSAELHYFLYKLYSRSIKDYAYYAYSPLSFLLSGNEFQRINYNALLFTKNISLYQTYERQNITTYNENSLQTRLIDEIRYNRQVLHSQLYRPIKERFLNVDSLNDVIQYKERELALESKYKDFSKTIMINEKDICLKLNNDDVAIEFVEATLPTLQQSSINNNIECYALVLRKQGEAPSLIPLCNRIELHGVLNKDNINKAKSLSELLWKPLKYELNDVKNIYFSPSGYLYKIAIENLPSPDGNGLMSDNYNMYRLSSTRELALDRTKVESKDAAIYGGMQYNTDVTALEDNARLYASVTRSDESLYNPYIDSLGVKRDDRKDPYKGLYLNPLPNAKVEANTITQTINDAHIKDFVATVYTDAAATETSFKALSGQKKRVIHVATHGFYYKEEDAEKFKDIMPQLQLDDRFAHRYIEDKQLTRSGLYFAGADNKRLGVEIPEGVDDGILTAQEISMLDLRGCDLVVLSACQTAQGDIGADGVFGLQRAFKKAGVNSILMSIDKIDDRATQLLMTEFYKNYVKGISKQESLKRAQKYLREETEYKDTKYWSSFILLDALD